MKREAFAPYRVARTASTAARVLSRYALLQLRDEVGPFRPRLQEWQRAHELAATSLRDLGLDLRGLFVKVCQVGGARADVLPEPFLRHLGPFHDDVPPRDFASLVAEVEAAVGKPLDRVFAEIDETPLAAASLAQVHRARLRSGEAVAIKIQYPEIGKLAGIDLGSVRRVARVAQHLRTDFPIRTLVDELAHMVSLELDFLREAEATERVRKAFEGAPEFSIPRVYREFCSRRVLVLEYLDGIRISDVERLKAAGADLTRVTTRIADAYRRMIFEHGFFQGDPHPGNLLWLPGDRVGILDFGLAKELPPGFAKSVATLLVSALAGDTARAAEAAEAAGFTLDPERIDALVPFVRRFLSLQGDADSENFLSANPVLGIPHHFTLIARVVILLNGLSQTLAPGQALIQRAFMGELAAQLG